MDTKIDNILFEGCKTGKTIVEILHDLLEKGTTEAYCMALQLVASWDNMNVYGYHIYKELIDKACKGLEFENDIPLNNWLKVAKKHHKCPFKGMTNIPITELTPDMVEDAVAEYTERREEEALSNG